MSRCVFGGVNKLVSRLCAHRPVFVLETLQITPADSQGPSMYNEFLCSSRKCRFAGIIQVCLHFGRHHATDAIRAHVHRRSSAASPTSPEQDVACEPTFGSRLPKKLQPPYDSRLPYHRDRHLAACRDCLHEQLIIQSPLTSHSLDSPSLALQVKRN